MGYSNNRDIHKGDAKHLILNTHRRLQDGAIAILELVYTKMLRVFSFLLKFILPYENSKAVGAFKLKERNCARDSDITEFHNSTMNIFGISYPDAA